MLPTSFATEARLMKKNASSTRRFADTLDLLPQPRRLRERIAQQCLP
jgi:hypothetical protein